MYDRISFALLMRFRNAACTFVFTYLIVVAGGMLIVACWYNDSLRIWLAELCAPSIIAYIAISLPLSLIYSLVMTKDGGTAIKHRPTWFMMDYFNLVLQMCVMQIGRLGTYQF